MDFIKRHLSNIILITIVAAWIGISLGTNQCPSCVIENVAGNAFGSSPPHKAKAALPVVRNVNWSVEDTAGKQVTSEDVNGKVSVLVYWATWCGACKNEIPDLIALRDEFSSSEVEIIGLSVDEPQKDLAAFAAKKGINYRIARVNQSIIDSFGQADAIPSVLILDQMGSIQFRHTGNVGKEILIERVRNLLATSPDERLVSRY